MIIELSDFFNNPSLVSVGSISIQYYAVTWILSAIFIYLHLANNSITKEIGISKEKANDLVFLYGLIFGAMIGGRIGYMLFYGFDQLINNPLKLFYIWEGGLSFHGGLIGVIISMFIFSKQNRINFIRLLDSAALSMPIGLCLVRIGNFLNGELYGRVTDGSWGFIFPTDPFGLTRHPSQLYESFGEGPLLFILLMIVNKYTKKRGLVAGSFLFFYGSIRFFIENFRQPDSHLGFVFSDFLTMGQLLCIPMILIGCLLYTSPSPRDGLLSRMPSSA